MNINKFLILGTGADINNINFDSIDGEFITAGVNRIYEKYIPDYYYVYDLNTVMQNVPNEFTVFTHPDKLAEYYRDNRNYTNNFVTYHDNEFTDNYHKDGVNYPCGKGSINYLIRVLNNYLFEGDDNLFFLAGVPLLESVGHFYEGKTTSTQIVLDRFYNDFIRLKDKGYKIVSLMKESKLNTLFPVDDINLIYGVNNAIS